MDVVSATSGVFAVVFLAIQLAGTIDDVSRFLRNIRGALAELASLCEALDQMRMTLDQAYCFLEQQFMVLHLPGSPEPIAPSFAGYAFEMRFLDVYGRVPTSLSCHPVIRGDNPVYYMCERGDIEGLQTAFSSGSVSPFALNVLGRSLLFVRIPVRRIGWKMG